VAFVHADRWRRRLAGVIVDAPSFASDTSTLSTSSPLFWTVTWIS
jgi:hypothetical protein